MKVDWKVLSWVGDLVVLKDTQKAEKTAYWWVVSTVDEKVVCLVLLMVESLVDCLVAESVSLKAVLKVYR